VRLTGKAVIATGGGTGIGAAIAREFAARGAEVLIASRSAEHLEPVAAAIRQEGGTAESVTCDVRDADQVEATVEPAFGRFDVLINNHAASFFWAAACDPEGSGEDENLQATQLHLASVCCASSRLPSQPWSTGVTRHDVPL